MNSFLRFVSLFFLQASVLLAFDLELLNTEALKPGEVLRWRLNGATETHMYRDPAHCPVLIVTGPDGAEERRPFFINQDAHETTKNQEPRTIGPQWLEARQLIKVHGKHTLTVISREGEAWATKEFFVPDGAKWPGYIQRHPKNPWLLASADGTPFMSYGANIGWAASVPRGQHWQSYISAAAAGGVNHIRIWLSSWCGQFTNATQADDWRLEHAWLIDQVFAQAEQQNLRVTVVLDNAHDIVHGHMAPYGQEKLQRIGNFFAPELSPYWLEKTRYAVARWGAYDSLIAWELFNEVDEALIHLPLPGENKEREIVAKRWLNTAAQELKRIDQQRHLVTASLGPKRWYRALAAPHLDWLQVHRYILPADELKAEMKQGLHLVARDSSALRALERPYIFGELDFQGKNYHNPFLSADVDGLALRRLLWTGIMAGGSGTGMPWWWDTDIHPRQRWQAWADIRRVAELLDWRDQDLQPLRFNAGATVIVAGWASPTQALVWALPHRDGWHSRLIDQAPPVRYAKPGPTIILPHMAQQKSFQVTAFQLMSSSETQRMNVTSDERGFVSWPVGQQPASSIWLLKAD
jgi:hypothetical protein